MTIHTSSSSTAVKDYGGELGLFPVNEPTSGSQVKRNFSIIALTCLFCYAVFVSALILKQQDAPRIQEDSDFAERILESRNMIRSMFESLNAPENVEKCPHGYQLYSPTHKCFKVIHKPTTLHKASLTCLEDEAFVASIHDVKENEHLVKIYKETNEYSESSLEAPHHKDIDFWAGLIHLNGKWVWLDRSPVKFVNWEKGMPDVKNKKNSCVLVESKDGKWKNVECHEKKAFVCEKSPVAH